jgi:hypothetical protein
MLIFEAATKTETDQEIVARRNIRHHSHEASEVFSRLYDLLAGGAWPI